TDEVVRTFPWPLRFSDVDVKKNMNGVLSALKNKTDEVVRTFPWPHSKGESKKKKRGGGGPIK
ncbi:MAG: hypothetical protein QF704_17975, partial [Anaerolineales bacterium]|nr:hypothetical protein [Anaerolineales bacterium]